MDALPALLALGAVQLAAVMSPGPTFFLISQTAARHGRGAGMSAVFGASAAALLWAGAAMLGLELLFEKARWLQQAMQLFGGLYLVWIGIRLWRKKGLDEDVAVDTKHSGFWQGFTTSVGNPKVILFFGSILSAVFDPALPGWVKLAAMGVIATNELLWYSTVATLFSTETVRRNYRRAGRKLDRIFGTLLIGFGTRLAWGSRN
ncbi:LysE family translocator [Bryobacter aggregatus]|uniref:LysE family translocator n=1 Tax=Bryobacter aggregatus TaxID=360054 RepID=UPI000690011B|nr:LysE family transporter [Bryobacter aggregatus]